MMARNQEEEGGGGGCGMAWRGFCTPRLHVVKKKKKNETDSLGHRYYGSRRSQ